MTVTCTAVCTVVQLYKICHVFSIMYYIHVIQYSCITFMERRGTWHITCRAPPPCCTYSIHHTYMMCVQYNMYVLPYSYWLTVPYSCTCIIHCTLGYSIQLYSIGYLLQRTIHQYSCTVHQCTASRCRTSTVNKHAVLYLRLAVVADNHFSCQCTEMHLEYLPFWKQDFTHHLHSSDTT